MKRVKEVRSYFLLNINMVIRLMILSDVVWGGAIGLLGPIFAIFIVDFVEGGSAIVAGVAAAVYLVTKSLAQIPAASIIDRIRGEKDDYAVLIGGSLLSAVFPISYLFVHTPGELYLVQFFYGLIAATTFPSFMAIFTRHIDRKKEGTEWGTYFTLTDLSSALAASVGGVIAETIGFNVLIIALSIVSVLGVLLLIPIKPYLKMK